MQKIKLDVTKIPREAIFVGSKGKYVDLVLKDNRDGTDQYGNDGFVSVDTTKEQRAAGEKGVIVGNWKYIGPKPTAATKPAPVQPKPGQPDFDVSDDDIPFN